MGQNIFSRSLMTKLTMCGYMFMKRKDEVFNKFVQWKAEVETITGRKLKVLRTDNGGE